MPMVRRGSCRRGGLPILLLSLVQPSSCILKYLVLSVEGSLLLWVLLELLWLLEEGGVGSWLFIVIVLKLQKQRNEESDSK